ncbi:putative disease resistance protein RGA4 [Hibiscus syriacus]|uniref:putative disease resistance protein RGA4 n=1 Tax=Hibiscus syriacus TaxID=106335 RepID=UPI001921781C|nr:putative disease resistance protein RGA4 [Hibiscus syriacus]
MESANGRRCDDLLGMDALQFQLRDLLLDKRYLLVLDDVWNEDEDEWDKLKTLLSFGAEESKVIVTTRSAKVAEIVGTVSSHHLKGLSDDECWALFKQRAFSHGQEDRNNTNLFPIGKQIVKKCGGVPLAAKTLGGLMRFKREPTEWLRVQECEENEFGDVIECRMHGIIHDLAKSVAGEEYFVFEGGRMPRNFAKLRSLVQAKKLRTLILLYLKGDLGEVPTKLFSSFKYLRVLDLGNCGIKRVQDTISCLKYLRYLNLSNTLIEMLPESICRLHNLQVLNLSGCFDLIKLPSSLSRLLSLRHLVIKGCERLTRFPGNFSRLTCLQTLPLFVVASEANFRGNANLMDLRRLQLKGELTIRKLENVKREFSAQANLEEKNLRSLELSWGDDHEGLNLNMSNDFICKMGENVLECLQPPENLKRLSLKGYPGTFFPRWMCTPKLLGLTKLELINCNRCHHLPTLGELPFLEVIYMCGMNAVKTIGREFYGEDTRRLFGSLKELTLIDFPDLELWWSINGGKEFQSLVTLTINKCPKLKNMPQFPSVKRLELRNCHETLLMSAINVSSLSILVIAVFTGQLIFGEPRLSKTLTIRWCEELVSLPQQLQNLSCLQSLEISECHSLSAPPQSISGLVSLKHLSIENCSNISLLPIGLQHLTSLEHLTIMYCPNLVSLPNEWQNLSMLRSLCILSCPQLSFLPDSLQYANTLQNLEIHGCHGLNALPEWILNLSLLRSLAISDCPNITSLPDNLQCLGNLQRLSIQECPRLEEHYKKI